MRVPARMWGVERDPRASLGRRGARGGGLVVVFWALLPMSNEIATSVQGLDSDDLGRCNLGHTRLKVMT